MTVFSLLVKRKEEWISAVVLFLTVMPFLILSFFSHPSFIDDYCFATKTMEQGLIKAFMDWYNNWTGRYSLCFIMSMNPLVIRSFFLCQVLLFSLVALLPVLFFFLAKTVLPGRSSSLYLNFTALFSFLYYFQLPNVNEGLYWMTGAFAYQLPNVCLLLLLILLIRQYASSAKSMLLLLSAFLIVVLIGTNEISMATFFVFIALIFFRPLFTQKKLYSHLLVLFIITSIAALAVILCPGNELREDLFPLSRNVGQAIKMTVLGFGYYSLKWSVTTFLIVVIVLYLVKKEQIAWSHHRLNVPFITSFLFFLSILLAGFFVPAWATGQMPNPRAINVLYLIFILGIFYHTLFAAQFVEQYLKMGKPAFWASVILIGCLTTYSSKYWTNNIKNAYVDLISGRAYRYDQAMLHLYETGEVPVLTNDSTPLSTGAELQSMKSMYAGCPEQYLQNYHKGKE